MHPFYYIYTLQQKYIEAIRPGARTPQYLCVCSIRGVKEEASTSSSRRALPVLSSAASGGRRYFMRVRTQNFFFIIQQLLCNERNLQENFAKYYFIYILLTSCSTICKKSERNTCNYFTTSKKITSSIYILLSTES